MSPRWISILLFIGICSVLCSAKRNFEIIMEYAEITDVDTEMVLISYTINKYNRTTKALSANFTLLKDFENYVSTEIQVFALFNNLYRPVPVKFKRNICDMFKNEFLWVKSEVEKYSHFPTKCPVLSGDYYLKDFVPNGGDFPAVANLPWTKVMIRTRFFFQDKLFFTLKSYFIFDHDAELKSVG